jgi:serine acetyltransferase
MAPVPAPAPGRGSKPLENRCNPRAHLFAIDIHQAATIGKGIFPDQATSIVIGETAVVGNNVSIIHGRVDSLPLM